MSIKISEMLGKKIYTTKGLYVGEVYDAMINLEKASVGGIVVSDVGRGCMGDKVSEPTRKIILPYGVVSSIGNIVLVKPLGAKSVARNPLM